MNVPGQNMTLAQFEDLRRRQGEENTKLLVQMGVTVDGRPMTLPLPPAITPQTPTGAPTMNTNTQTPGPLTQAVQPQAGAQMPQGGALETAALGPLQAKMSEYQTAAKTQAQDRFAKQQEMIQTMYGGPTTSETLFALSRALLAPRQFTGFGSTMGKISGAFGDIDQQRRAAEQKRGEAQMLLQSSYGDRTTDLMKDELSNEIELAKIAARYADADRRADEAKYDIDPTSGAYKLRPGTGGDLGILTPEQAIVAAQDPRNKGKTFYTTDGRQRTLK